MSTSQPLIEDNDSGCQTASNRLDVDHLLKGVGHDAELAAELIEMFQEDLPTMLANLQAAITEENLEVVKRLAHSLKTPMELFGATDARDQSHNLELAAVESEGSATSVLAEMFSGLRTELTEVSRQLQDVKLARP